MADLLARFGGSRPALAAFLRRFLASPNFAWFERRRALVREWQAAEWEAAALVRGEGKRAADHLAHLVIHGMLHLAGHDHDAAGPARVPAAATTERLDLTGLTPEALRAGLNDPAVLGAVLHALGEITKFVDFLVGDPLGRPGHAQAFHDLADFNDLQGFLQADDTHAGAAVRDAFDHAFVGEVNQS